MGLKEKILEDIKTAMKEKKQERVEVLRFLNAAIKNKEIEVRPNTLSDQDITAVIQKSVKQRNESIEQYKAAGREDLAEKENIELVILKEYLPQMLSEAELRKIVEEVVASTGATTAKDMGKVMKAAQEKTQGRADNKLLSQFIKEKLS